MLFARRIAALVLLLLLIAASVFLLPVAFALVLLGWIGQKVAEVFSRSVKAILELGKFEK